jgi:hypothetical protein
MAIKKETLKFLFLTSNVFDKWVDKIINYINIREKTLGSMNIALQVTKLKQFICNSSLLYNSDDYQCGKMIIYETVWYCSNISH